jgi:hypothetical protein
MAFSAGAVRVVGDRRCAALRCGPTPLPRRTGPDLRVSAHGAVVCNVLFAAVVLFFLAMVAFIGLTVISVRNAAETALCHCGLRALS